MRKFLFSALSVVAALLATTACSYDDTLIWDEVNNVKDRVDELEKQVNGINTNLTALQTIVNAMQDNVYVTAVNETADGYTIIFSNGTTATITNGKDGANGKDGQNGAPGNDGKDAIAPQVRINDATKEWEISTDGGKTWVSTGVVAEGKDGVCTENESLFASVEVENEYVIITLTNGTEFKLALYDDTCPRFIIECNDEVAEIEFGASVEFAVVAENVKEYTINKPEGWKVTYEENTLTVTAPSQDKCCFDEEGTIAITVVSHQGKSAIAKLNVRAVEAVTEEPTEPETPEEPEEDLGYELRVLTFEDADAVFESYYLEYAYNWSGKEIFTWSDLIDEKQYSGPLMYGNDSMDAMYYWYDEGNTELYHMFPDNYAYCYWGGGHAVSNYWGAGYTDEDRNTHIAKYYGQDYVEQWAGKPGADAALGWFLLQLMTPVPAHSGDNFCVHYGYKDDYSFIENLPEWTFADCEPRVIDHMYVTNTIYTLNQLYNGVKSEEGNSFGGNWSGLSEDAWLKIVAYGFESVDDDEPVSEVEFYLVDGLNVVENWQKWDLSGLGAVAKVRFNFLYSDEMGGRYGFTIPGYFAYDDVAVRFEK